MEKAYTKTVPSTFDEFTASRDYLEQVIRQLQSPEALKRRHDETEKTIQQEGQELCRLLYQAALDVQANSEVRRESVTGEDNVVRTHFRQACPRKIASVFGEVTSCSVSHRSR